jgi:hypothetical protein
MMMRIPALHGPIPGGTKLHEKNTLAVWVQSRFLGLETKDLPRAWHPRRFGKYLLTASNQELHTSDSLEKWADLPTWWLIRSMFPFRFYCRISQLSHKKNFGCSLFHVSRA